MVDYKFKLVDMSTYWANDSEEFPERVTTTRDGEPDIYEIGVYPVTLPTTHGALVVPPATGEFEGYNPYILSGATWFEVQRDTRPFETPASEVQDYLDEGWSVVFPGVSE